MVREGLPHGLNVETHGTDWAVPCNLNFKIPWLTRHGWQPALGQRTEKWERVGLERDDPRLIINQRRGDRTFKLQDFVELRYLHTEAGKVVSEILRFD